MESLRSKSASRSLGLFAFLFFALPLFLFLYRAAYSADIAQLTPNFFKILFRALAFGVVQAAASAVLAVALGAVVGFALASSRGAIARVLSKVIASVGVLFFVLPGVAVSLLVIEMSHVTRFVPSQGLAGIVFAHVLMNLFFFASVVESRIQAWLGAGGLELVEAGAVLGARPATLSMRLFAPLVLDELKTWLPLIFLWSFSAFATVLILGGGPEYSTLEVLLFHSLQNDGDAARILFLVFAQLIVAVSLARWTLRRNPLGSSGASLSFRSHRTLSARAWPARGFGFVAIVAAIVAVAPFLSLVLSALRARSRGGSIAGSEILSSSLVSLALAILTVLFVLLFSRLLVSAGSMLRRFFAFGLGISTTLLAAMWMGVGIDPFLDGHAILQILLAALLIASALLPLASLWIENRVGSIPREQIEAASVLGASSAETIKRVVTPQLSDLFSKLALMAGVGALGELAIASTLVRDSTLLSILSRQSASRYDFSAGAWIFLLMTLVTLALLGAPWLFNKIRSARS